MYYFLSAIFFGVALIATAAGIHFIREAEYWQRVRAVMDANTTIDPQNPPRIVVKKSPTGMGTMYLNDGGAARHTPMADFISYDDSFRKIRDGLRWLENAARASLLIGSALALIGVAGLLRTLFF